MNTTKIAKFLGKKGGDKTLVKYGKKHFSDAGRKGMASRWKKKLTTK